MRHRLRRLWLDLRMGTCSGFPPCCIIWYCTVWKVVFESSFWRRYSDGTADFGYIPCPLCRLSRARVTVRDCTAECGHLAESRQLIREVHPHPR